jgi:hypothetical protein
LSSFSFSWKAENDQEIFLFFFDDENIWIQKIFNFMIEYLFLFSFKKLHLFNVEYQNNSERSCAIAFKWNWRRQLRYGLQDFTSKLCGEGGLQIESQSLLSLYEWVDDLIASHQWWCGWVQDCRRSNRQEPASVRINHRVLPRRFFDRNPREEVNLKFNKQATLLRSN